MSTPNYDDLFAKLLKPVIRDHLLQHLQTPQDITSLMKASPGFLEAMKSLSLSSEWMNSETVNSRCFREYFRNKSLMQKGHVFQNGDRILIDNYFDMIYDLEPNYNEYEFLRPEFSTRFFGTSNMTRLWIFENFHSWNKIPSCQLPLQGNRNGHWKVSENPIVTRYVSLGNCFKMPLRRQPLHFLGEVGAEVRKLEFLCPEIITDKVNGIPPHHGFDALHSFLITVPSLTELVVHGTSVNKPPIPVQLPNPGLPQLKFLKCLKLFSRFETYEPFNGYWDQLTTLEVPSENFLEWYKPIESSIFLNLKRLSTTVCSQEQLIKVTSFQSALKEIKLRCPPEMRLLSCFQTFESFSNSLCAASINVDVGLQNSPNSEHDIDIDRKDGTSTFQFQLPDLRVLQIQNWDRVPLDDLLCLGNNSPAYLHLQGKNIIRPEMKTSGEKILNVRSHVYNLYKSNIWELMPGLVEVMIRGNVFKRATYANNLQQ